MSGITFDTLKFVETLRAAGMPEPHAKAISQAVRDAHETAEPVTKRDLHDLGVAMRGETQSLRSELKSDLQSLRAELQSEMQSLRSEQQSEMQSLRSELQSDMQSLRSELQSEMQSLRSEVKAGMQLLQAEMRAIEPRMTIRLGGLVVVALGAFTALSKWVA